MMISFPQAIVSFYRNYFVVFQGRASRAEFWWPQLLMLVVYGIVMTSVLVGIGLGYLGVLLFLWVALFFVHVLPLLIVLVRRLHDCNFAGWWLWLLFLFNLTASGLEDMGHELGAAFLWVISLLLFLYWTCKPGDTSENRFGPNPLAHAHTDADSTSNPQQTAEAN